MTRWLYQLAVHKDFPDPVGEIKNLKAAESNGGAFLKLANRDDPAGKNAAVGDMFLLAVVHGEELQVVGEGFVKTPAQKRLPPPSVDALYSGEGYFVELANVRSLSPRRPPLDDVQLAKFRSGQAGVKKLPEFPKYTISKLGRIDHASIEIRPLTVFMGQNGTNKTWAMYCLHALLQKLSLGGGASAESSLSEHFQKEAIAFLDTPTRGNWTSTCDRRTFVKNLRDPITISLPNLGADVAATGAVILGANVPGAKATLEVSIADLPSSPGLEIEITPAGAKVGLDDRSHAAFAGFGPERDGEDRRVNKLARLLERYSLGGAEVSIMPAERMALERQARPALLAHAAYEQLLDQSVRSAGFRSNERHATAINARIQTDDLGRTTVDAGGTSVPFLAAASLHKATLGIAAFLENAKRGDVLLIDEPEMNAHPASQVKLAELFAWMIRQGYRLVLATHSPYLVDHLCTLLEFGSLAEDKRIAAIELAKQRDVVTPPVDTYLYSDEVAAYEFGADGAIRDVFNRATGRIGWKTFTTVSDNEGRFFDTLLDIDEEARHA
jgi:hypothetical protein